MGSRMLTLQGRIWLGVGFLLWGTPLFSQIQNPVYVWSAGSTIQGDVMRGQGIQNIGNAHLLDSLGRYGLATQEMQRRQHLFESNRWSQLQRDRAIEADKKQLEAARLQLRLMRDEPATHCILSGKALNFLADRIDCSKLAPATQLVRLDKEEPRLFQIRYETRGGLTREIWNATFHEKSWFVKWPKVLAQDSNREAAIRVNAAFAEAAAEYTRDGKITNPTNTLLRRELYAFLNQVEKGSQFDKQAAAVVKEHFTRLLKISDSLLNGEFAQLQLQLLEPTKMTFEQVLAYRFKHGLKFSAASPGDFDDHLLLHQQLANLHRQQNIQQPESLANDY
jgi:hypothetical protein